MDDLAGDFVDDSVEGSDDDSVGDSAGNGTNGLKISSPRKNNTVGNLMDDSDDGSVVEIEMEIERSHVIITFVNPMERITINLTSIITGRAELASLNMPLNENLA